MIVLTKAISLHCFPGSWQAQSDSVCCTKVFSRNEHIRTRSSREIPHACTEDSAMVFLWSSSPEPLEISLHQTNWRSLALHMQMMSRFASSSYTKEWACNSESVPHFLFCHVFGERGSVKFFVRQLWVVEVEKQQKRVWNQKRPEKPQLIRSILEVTMAICHNNRELASAASHFAADWTVVEHRVQGCRSAICERI